MILPNNNISIMDVRNAISCPSVSLGYLCSAAQTGGRSGYAFNIKENGTNVDGLLINGAKPYFNLFSNASPAQWYRDGLSIKCRLLRDSSNKYMFSLGGFRGYDSAGVPPSIVFDVQEITFVINESTPVFVPVSCNLGSYNWNNIENITKVAMSLYNGITHLETKQFDYSGKNYSTIFEIAKGKINNNDKLTARLKLVFGQTAIDIIGLNTDGSGITSKEINCKGVTANAPECRWFGLYDTNGMEAPLTDWTCSLNGQVAHAQFTLAGVPYSELYSPFKLYYYIYNPKTGTTPEKFYQNLSVNIVPGRSQGVNVTIAEKLVVNDVVGISMYSS